MHAKFYEVGPKKKPDFIHLKQAIILFAEHCTLNMELQVEFIGSSHFVLTIFE